MTIVRAPRQPERFTRISNETIDDARLSFKALGLLAYILSKPDHWNVSREHLATTHADGQASVRSALRELRTAGYIVVETVHAAPGQLAGRRMVVHDTPQTGGPPSGRDPDRSETVRSDPPQVVTTEVGTTDLETTESPGPASPAPGATLFEVPTVVDELCNELAERVATQRGGARPPVTARWRTDMRRLLERGPLHQDEPTPVEPKRVRACLAVIFGELADPSGRNGFCWADQIRSPNALRDHWWQVYRAAQALHQQSRHGKLAPVMRAVHGGEAPDIGQVLAEHSRSMAELGLRSAANGYVPAIGGGQ